MRNLNGLFQARPSLHLSWPRNLDFSKLPGSRSRSSRRRSHSKLRAYDSKADNVTSLQTSFSPLAAIHDMSAHRWRLSDVQYAVLTGLCLFSLWIIDAHAPIIKSAAVLGYALLLAMPVTRQFFLPSWPIWTYLLYFFSSRYVLFFLCSRHTIACEYVARVGRLLHATGSSAILRPVLICSADRIRVTGTFPLRSVLTSG
jgi:inositol phosphorylceramide synthase catalytic subunit